MIEAMVIEELDSSSFEAEINDALRDGWSISGNHQVTDVHEVDMFGQEITGSVKYTMVMTKVV